MTPTPLGRKRRAACWPLAVAARALCGAVLCSGAGAARAGVAEAQQAVWAASPSEQRASWYGAARAALEAEDVLVIEAEDGAGPCTLRVARYVARQRGAEIGVCVSVASAAAGTREVVVRLARADGRSGQVKQTARARGLIAALRGAYRRAQLALELGDDGLLRLRSTPEGALASLDGQPAGHAPLERKLTPGRHQIAVALDGFATERRTVEVERGAVVDLHVTLPRAVHLAAEADPPTEPSALNYVVGGVLLAGAAPALAMSLATLVNDGDCSERGPETGACLERIAFGTRSAILLGAGAAALLAGGYLLLATPLEVEVQAGPGAARLRGAVRF